MPTSRPGSVNARRALGLVALWAAACLDDGNPITPPAVTGPLVTYAAVAPGPHNVLSAVVSLELADADSVIVWYRLDDTAAARDNVTPAFPARQDSVTVPVLGLFPGRPYVLAAVVYGPGGITRSDSLHLTTDTLPDDLPSFTASGPDPAPGYIAFSAGRYALVIDNTGRVVWYRAFALGPGLNFQPQPTGRYVARPPTPDPSDREPWVELDVLGNVTRTLDCVGGVLPRFHDMIAEAGGSYWIMCDDTRAMDLSAVGGVVNAQVTGTVIQHVDAAGQLLFAWNPFDHFAITDLDSAGRAGPTVNWTHGNALDLDTDGNLLVSFRSLSEITKIDTRSGAVLWRMGGRRNQFLFAAPGVPFSRQHGLRAVAPGQIALLDNLGEPSGSRGERYAVDEATRRASLLTWYASTPATTAQLGGTTQGIGTHTLVSYGNGNRVEEYDAAGRVVWRIEGDPGYVFRATRIRSLYAPVAGATR